jgi:glycosyltransferase involved in cell wall biosynthesis
MRLLLIGAYPPPHGGLQTHLVAIRRSLSERAIPCRVISLSRKGRQKADGVYYPKNALSVLLLLLSLPYDIAHLHLGGNLTARLLALSFICCSLPGKRTVLTFHSGGYPSSPAGLGASPRSFRGFVLQRFDRLIAVNSQLLEFFKKCGVPPAKTRLIPPFAAVDVPPGAALTPELESFFATHSPVLLTVGLLEPEYDLPLQIRVLGMVRENFPGSGLVIVGSGGLEGELRKRIQATPYREHLLLCGDVSHDSTLVAIQRCSVLLRTTLYDGDSISVREALRLGTPVIATDNGMRPRGVVLVPPSDLNSLRSAIERSLPAKRMAAGQNPTDGDKNVAEVVALYQELVH